MTPVSLTFVIYEQVLAAPIRALVTRIGALAQTCVGQPTNHR